MCLYFYLLNYSKLSSLSKKSLKQSIDKMEKLYASCFNELYLH